MSEITDQGVVDGLPSHIYHAHDSLSATGLKLLASKTPAHFRYRMDNPENKGAFDLGTAAHSLILEDDDSKIQRLDFSDWRTKAAQKERDEAYAAGLTPLLEKDYQVVLKMRDSVAAHSTARLALEGGKAEQSLFWKGDDGTAFRARPDKLDLESRIGPLVVDLKSTVNADPRRFGKIAFDLGYYQQQPHYCEGVEAVTGFDPTFIFVLVEKEPPYLVSVVELDQDAVALGKEENARATLIYNECKASGQWPGYPDSDPISLPAWATR